MGGRKRRKQGALSLALHCCYVGDAQAETRLQALHREGGHVFLRVYSLLAVQIIDTKIPDFPLIHLWSGRCTTKYWICFQRNPAIPSPHVICSLLITLSAPLWGEGSPEDEGNHLP